MKPRKKNSFFTLVFSFCPGAAEMYMGFMKNGLSILMAFATPVLITGALEGNDYIMIISMIIYAVGFFHARHIATAPDDEFNEFKDQFIWDELLNTKTSGIENDAYKKWGAIILIFIGACGVWSFVRDALIKVLGENAIIRLLANSVPRLAFSALVITIGVLLIKGRKKELVEDNSDEPGKQ